MDKKPIVVSPYVSLFFLAVFIVASFAIPHREAVAQLIHGNTFDFWKVGQGGLTVTGSTTLTGGLSVTGVTDASNASTGIVGEVAQATVAAASAVGLSTATAKNVTSLALSAGDWDVSASCNRTLSGVTATVYSCSISPTSATMMTHAVSGVVGSDALVQQNATFGTTITGEYSQRIPNVRVSTGSATTVYLVAKDTFSAGSNDVFGTVNARRVR